MEDESLLDESLECFAGTGPQFHGGLSNHGPMVVEALVQLGEPAAALPWAVRYRERLDEAPAATGRIDRSGWREALGDQRRTTDWVSLFAAELSEESYVTTAQRWLPRLLPGLRTGGTHGPIRTFHALRALQRAETAPRLDELARALAYWAASYRTLPGDPRPVGGADLEDAALGLSRTAPAEDAPGLISEAMLTVAGRPRFGAMVSSLRPDSDVPLAFSRLTEVGARAYLANADHAPIGLVHAVTAPAAVRGMLWLLPEADQHMAFAYAWQAVAALLAGQAPAGLAPCERLGASAGVPAVVEQAVASGDAHAIKLTEACLREDALAPAPAYLVAATDVGTRLGAGG
ncbi:MAG TPA: hypothetical protein VI138_01990 [Candidatus Dormibacteraeota bacterium]